MFYSTLAIVFAVMLLGMVAFAFAGRRKAKITRPAAEDTPEPIKRGQYLNK